MDAATDIGLSSNYFILDKICNLHIPLHLIKGIVRNIRYLKELYIKAETIPRLVICDRIAKSTSVYISSFNLITTANAWTYNSNAN